jgi:surfactin synthase thioesterase subunit
MKKTRLFCFPYAGGSAAVFNDWKPLVPDHLELVAVELAGRGRRIKDPHYDTIADAAADLYNIIKKDLDTAPYAFFGHSMGAAIALELAYKCIANYHNLPSHIFFSGRNAPHITRESEKMFHRMTEQEFRAEVVELGGTSKEFFEHPELLEIFLPLLRNDFKINETYTHQEGRQPLDCNITVLYSTADEMLTSDMEEWRKYTDKGFQAIPFEGDHFFISERAEEVIGTIDKILSGELTGG